MGLPKISCICITRKRPASLIKAIRCFREQTYQNKELLIYFEDDDIATAGVGLQDYGSNVKFVKVNAYPKMKLGQLRNLAISNADGEYFCQWDDDDWYHRDRLTSQYNALIENHKEASILLFWIMYDTPSQKAYLSTPYYWEGSILCKRTLHALYQYEHLQKGEDTPFVKNLIKHNAVYPLIRPSLYIYIHTGQNTWNSEHFKTFFSKSLKLSENTSNLIRGIIDGTTEHVEACDIMSSQYILKELNYFSWTGLF
jgi:glycosyltransferase involved in cell wall biosynthesis